MKMALYIIFLFVEIVVDFLAISLAWTNLGWLPCIVTIAIGVVLLVRQILMLIKVNDIENKRKIRRKIALVMLVPILGFVIMFIYWFFDLSSAI